MKKAVIPAFMLLLGSAVLGATVFHQPLAEAAAPIASVFVTNDASSPVPIREQDLDANGNIKTHEQGIAKVSVDGVVATQPTDPANSFSVFSQVDNPGLGNIKDVDGCDPSLPAGTRWLISSVALTSLSDSKIGLASLGLFPRGEAFAVVSGPQIATGSFDTPQLTFPEPFVLTAPRDGLCLRSIVYGNGTLLTTVVGHRR
jgi:hypothetical protein